MKMEKEFKEKLMKQREYYKKKIHELTQGECICTDEWLDEFYISREKFNEFIKRLKDYRAWKDFYRDTAEKWLKLRGYKYRKVGEKFEILDKLAGDELR